MTVCESVRKHLIRNLSNNLERSLIDKRSFLELCYFLYQNLVLTFKVLQSVWNKSALGQYYNLNRIQISLDHSLWKETEIDTEFSHWIGSLDDNKTILLVYLLKVHGILTNPHGTNFEAKTILQKSSNSNKNVSGCTRHC